MPVVGRGYPSQSTLETLPTPPKVTAIQFDSIGTASFMVNAAGTISWTHNISPKATVLFVVVSNVSTHNLTQATCGGKAMTYLPGPTYPNEYLYATNSGLYGLIDIFYLMNPPTGLQTVTHTTTLTNYVHANSISYLNCSGFNTGSVNPGYLSNTTTSTASISATAPVGQKILNVMSYWWNGVGTGNFSSYNQTVRYSPVITLSNGNPLLIGEAPGSGSATTFSANLNNVYAGWGCFALPLYPLVLPEPKVPTTQVVVSRAGFL